MRNLNDDQRVADALRARFRLSPYSEIRELKCDFRDGTALLRGRVPSFYLRQIAQSLAVSMVEVRSLKDDIEVA